MSNWVTLQNGVHIDLDDPENPITGSGSFENYLGSGKGYNARKNANKGYEIGKSAYKNTTFTRTQLTKMSKGKLADILEAKKGDKNYDPLDETFGSRSNDEIINDILKTQSKASTKTTVKSIHQDHRL